MSSETTATAPLPRRVGLYPTCLVDLLRPGLIPLARRLLEACGCEVHLPHRRSCCGQPAWNGGDPATAADLARRFVRSQTHVDAVVVLAASCCSTLHSSPQMLAGDGELAQRAAGLAAHTYELCTFLHRFGGALTLPGWSGSVTLHDSCSAQRLGSAQALRALLRAVPGLQRRDGEEGEGCCGFGGSFSVSHPELSSRIADDEVRAACASGADTLIGVDLGCLLHLAGRLRAAGARIEVRHAVEVLAGCRNLPPLA